MYKVHSNVRAVSVSSVEEVVVLAHLPALIVDIHTDSDTQTQPDVVQTVVTFRCQAQPRVWKVT